MRCRQKPAAGAARLMRALADSQADSPKSWTTPWSNALVTRRCGSFRGWMTVEGGCSAGAFCCVVSAADHGVVLDYGAASFHIKRLIARRRRFFLSLAFRLDC